MIVLGQQEGWYQILFRNPDGQAAIGYVSEAPSQTEAVAERIYTVATLVPGVSYLAVFLIIWFAYPLTKREVERNTEILRRKREEA